MRRGVLYVLDGTKLAVRLVVSINSLRNYYSGPVCVASGDPAAAGMCERLSRDPQLGVSHVRIRVPTSIKKHRGYILKTLVNEFSPFDVSLFLDCDTLVRGPVDELFDMPSPEHIIATQFCDWGTAHGIVRRRIRAWGDLQPRLVQRAIEFGKAVNTGVFAFTPQTSAFERWFPVALSGQDRFIPDEIALQLLLPQVPVVMLDQRFNCSAKFGDPAAPDTRIVHFHGRRHVGRYGGLWITAYEKVVEENLADIRSWTPAADRQLKNYLCSTNGVKQ